MAGVFHPISKFRLETENNPWMLSSIPQTFVLRLMNHEKVLFIGKVKALQSINRYGSFSILAGHTNFITIIYQKLFYYPAVGDKIEIDIDSGMLRYLNNSADVYLGIEASEELEQLNLGAVELPAELVEQQQVLDQLQGLQPPSRAQATAPGGAPGVSSPKSRG